LEKPIAAEVRTVREAQAKKFDYDLMPYAKTKNRISN
jgi:hypothetical protein